MQEFSRIIRYCWLSFVISATEILPDLRPICRFRGWLVRWCFASCGKDLQIQSGVRIAHSNEIHVGDHVFIARGAIIQGPNIVIGNEVQIGPYAVIVTGDHALIGHSYRYGHGDCESVSIGEGSWIGSHAVITKGVTIGIGVAIGAGAVVTKTIPSHSIAAGVPARILKSTNLIEQKIADNCT